MIKKILVSIVGLLVVVYAGFWVTAPVVTNPEQYMSLVEKYDVRIIRDAHHVPHIFGERDVDVAFGLAYAHSEDDFETIQDVVLLTRGKLATLRGPEAAKTDYLVQFMGVWDVVNEGYDTRISQATRNHAEAYADGLNYFAAKNPNAVAPEVLPFTGKDLVAGYTFKTPLFYGFDQAVAAVVEGRYGTGLDKTAFLQVTNEPQPDLGSQGIAVAPSRSTDGHTRLLVNSHQPLTGPVAWYEARVKSGEGWDMAGGTFPASPLILHGHGPTLGWSNTVNKPDLIDVYELVINPENENQYKLDGEWRDFEITDVPLDVTFWGPIRWTFREPLYRSAHGPVFRTEKGAFALKWAGMDEMRTLEQNIALNKARTKEQFETALAMTSMPSINYVYADKDGNIGHYYNAMMPKRIPGINWQGLVPGDRSDLIWQGYVSAAEMPRTVNPTSGFVYNANNTPFEASQGVGQPEPSMFPNWMGVETHMTNRALRIKELFSADDAISADDFRIYKYDNSYASTSITGEVISTVLAMQFEPDSDLAKGQNILASWDHSSDASSRSAALAVLTGRPFVMANMRGEPAPEVLTSFRDTVALLLKHFGRLDPEWGKVNRLVRGNKSWPLSGAPDVLRAVYGVFDEETGYQHDIAGDSYIMFVDWAQDGTVSSRTIHNFGSATLDMTSPYYSDQAGLFAAEEERSLPLTMEALLAEKTGDIRLGEGR